MRPLFSILIVSLNPGEKLKRTLGSVLRQYFEDYEVIVKDGVSTDGSLSFIEGLSEEKRSRIRIVSRPDQGIYDAMNQAAGGEVCIFSELRRCLLREGCAFSDGKADRGKSFQAGRLLWEYL